MDASVEVVPIELAGHGARMGEPCYSNFEEAVQDIVQSIRSRLKDGRFILFGHSMGGLLAYETVLRLASEANRQADMLVISATEPPHLRRQRNLHLLPDDKLLQELVLYGGMREEIFEDPMLLEQFLPIIRSDFKLLASYTPALDIRPVSCPIQVLNGDGDQTLDQAKLPEWRTYTTDHFNINTLGGDHFFIREHSLEIIQIIQSRLNHFYNKYA